MRDVRRSAVVVLWVLGAVMVGAQAPAGEWLYFGGDKAFTRYSPLDQIDRDNVKELRIVWRRPAVDPELRVAFPDLQPDAYLKSTPLMIDGVLYAPNALGLVDAFDPATGETVWRQPPLAATMEEVVGRSTRGVDYWTDGTDQRLFLVRGEYLYALNLKTGRRYPSFGLSDQGRVGLHWDRPLANRFSWTGGPIVVGDVVVVAGTTGGAGDGGVIREAAPEDVRGFDVRTGELLWSFHVVPRPGEFGADTWGDGSADYSGDLGSWCCLTADEALGFVYVPLSAPTGMVYGGHRPGDNLFSDSLVALDAKTGARVWHFQMVHHDVWEYDTVGPPTLGDITVDGRVIKAVMQPSKTAFLYVFDRETGEPVWPIEERKVPQSIVPGERTSSTQPFPTKPPPFDLQGITEDDLIDFTPALHAAALEAVESLVLGPLFTPPWPRSDDPDGKLGTLTAPGGWGAGNWHTGAFDPETGIYYAVSHTMPTVWSVAPTTSDPDATLAWATPRGEGQRVGTPRPHGLPITKPPYGRITALDLHRGELAWMAANGDGPRNHPLLRDIDLPPLGTPNRPAPLVTKTLLLIGEGSDAIIGTIRGEGETTDPEQDQSWRWGDKFRAYDKRTGAVLWETELPAGTTGGPMTYMFDGKQYIVVSVGARDHDPEWVALALP
ncbi:MAG: PQQ-binding-like beta-propeller repeat protein [Vicinamibacterales bacterium]|jgi:quinoprotein glucose dehydrogenase|nr:PQQ-binding-like beta-propeller repeat protein [Vicinamibacterales bacterium]